MADLFWNHNRKVCASHYLAGITIFFICSSGFITADTFASGRSISPIINTQNLLSTNIKIGIIIALITTGMAILFSFITSSSIGGKDLTPGSRMQNLIQNFVQFCLLYFLIFFATILSDQIHKIASGFPQNLILSALIGLTGAITYVGWLPLNANLNHLIELRKTPERFPSLHAIANHITFLCIYVSVVIVIILTWVWLSVINLIAT